MLVPDICERSRTRKRWNVGAFFFFKVAESNTCRVRRVDGLLHPNAKPDDQCRKMSLLVRQIGRKLSRDTNQKEERDAY